MHQKVVTCFDSTAEHQELTTRAWTYGTEAERQRREHIWTGIRTAKEAKKGGGDRRIGLAMATGGAGELSGACDGWRWGWARVEVSEKSYFSYLKEGRGHRSSWHAIIGWHVAHHWTGSSGRTLQKHKEEQHTVSVHAQHQQGANIITEHNRMAAMAKLLVTKLAAALITLSEFLPTNGAITDN